MTKELQIESIALDKTENGVPVHFDPSVKKSRFIPLRYRFILITSVMLLLLLTTLALVLGVLQKQTLKKRIENQGLIIAKNLAAISVDHLMTYNYVALEKLANQAVNNPDIIHVIIHDKEGRVAGYSRRPDLQNKILTDSLSLTALESATPLVTVHTPASASSPVMEVAVPVLLPGSRDRWGTIRVCLSLELMYQQFRQTIFSILLLGFIALAIGILMSNWVAQRVTRPLGTLVTASVEASQGNLNPDISIHTRDEVEILASNFSYMIREILAQKQQLEHQLKEIKHLQQYAEKILDTMSDGLLAIDMDGFVAAMNPAARHILDITKETDVKDRHISELIHPGSRFAAFLSQSLDQQCNEIPCEIQLKRGEIDQILLVGASLLDSDKKTPRQMIFNLHDITQLKQLETKIRQNQRLADLGTLAAGMAHEIRNPLSAIKTFVALLPHKIKKPGFLDKFQTTVQREINRLNTLIEELLELARPPKYNFKPANIVQLIEQSLDLMEADLNEKGIQIKQTVSEHLPPVMADENQLEKVFINLIQNSAQAMPDGGDIHIHAEFKNAQVFITFSDTGPGFSQELAADIFNPFFTTKASGTGLGLAISHKVICEHKGQISAVSRDGQGACFSICLPGLAE